MSDTLPIVYFARHGDTAWTVSGQHTGRTDLPLISNGELNAKRLGERLSGLKFVKVITSPLQRATRTCELAGFGAVAELDPDLTEWDYGHYEGLLSAEIHAERPNWELFSDGCPGGESPAQITERADRVIQRVRAVDSDVLLFSSGHFIRVLASRWLALSSCAGKYLLLSPASLSAVSYEHNRADPAIRFWNDTNHVVANTALEKISYDHRNLDTSEFEKQSKRSWHETRIAAPPTIWLRPDSIRGHGKRLLRAAFGFR